MIIIQKIVNAFRWNKAINLTSNAEYAAALLTLESINQGCLRIALREYHVLRSYLLLRTNDPRVKSAVAEAISSIDRSPRASDGERAYLKKYCEWILSSLHNSGTVSMVDYSEINLEKVAPRTKDLFPLRNHPKWP